MRIVLIGQQHCGKTTKGKILGQQQNLPFFDLDELISQDYAQMYDKHAATPREIVEQHGESFFRSMETQCLTYFIRQKIPAFILAVGGGTPMLPANKKLLNGMDKIIYLTADKDVIFRRLINNGIPAYFPKEITVRDYFDEVYEKRHNVYLHLATEII